MNKTMNTTPNIKFRETDNLFQIVLLKVIDYFFL